MGYPSDAALPPILDSEPERPQFVNPGTVLGCAFQKRWQRDPITPRCDQQLEDSAALGFRVCHCALAFLRAFLRPPRPSRFIRSTSDRGTIRRPQM